MDSGEKVAVVRMRRHAFDAIIQHVRDALPREACGVLGGSREIEMQRDRGWVRGTFIEGSQPVKNIAITDGRFDMDAKSLLIARAELLINSSMLPLGYYHSHPNGNLDASPTDIDGGLWPGVVAELHLIAAPTGDAALYQVWTDGWHRIPFELGPELRADPEAASE